MSIFYFTSPNVSLNVKALLISGYVRRHLHTSFMSLKIDEFSELLLLHM